MFLFPVGKGLADAAANGAGSQRTATGHHGNAFAFAVGGSEFLIYVNEGADEAEVLLARVSNGGEGTEAARVHDVAKEGFAEVIGGMTEGDDVGTKLFADLIDRTAAETAAKVAAMVRLFFEQAERGVVCEVLPRHSEALDVFADGLNGAQEFALFHCESAEGKVDWGAFLQEQEGFEEGNGILAPGDCDRDGIAGADHIEAMDGFADFPQQCFFEIHCYQSSVPVDVERSGNGRGWLMVEVFFEVFQAGVKDLFDAVYPGEEDVFGVVNATVNFVEARIQIIEPPINVTAVVTEALIVDENANEHGKCGKCGRGDRSHELIRDDH